ncbi:hypothetical protein EKN07_11730 [Actinobaculum sp. 352]|nr:hypothetical protein EKN07_11730 [Actinobaculum sp. 352]
MSTLPTTDLVASPCRACPDEFFPHPGETKRRAAAIRMCQTCPVLGACTRYVADLRNSGIRIQGIWAGRYYVGKGSQRQCVACGAEVATDWHTDVCGACLALVPSSRACVTCGRYVRADGQHADDAPDGSATYGSRAPMCRHCYRQSRRERTTA